MQRSAPGRRGRPRFTIIVMTLLSITVLTLSAKNVPVLSSVRSGVISALQPVQSALRSAATPFRNAWNGIGNYGDLEAENRRLRKELAKVKGRQLANADAAAQVDQLKAQLGIPFVTDFKKVTTQVSTGNFSSFDDNTAQIDKGSNAGIGVGMPVVSPAGVVGRIMRVTPDRSVVQLITDPDLRLGIRLPSDAKGVLRGAGAGRPLVVEEGIGLSVPVKKGDPIMTSGLERAILPRGLPVGTVRKITRVQSDQTQVLEVKPAADLSKLDYVQVLLWEPKP